MNADPGYYDWESQEVTAGAAVFKLVSKPGVPFFRESDPSSHLLAESLLGGQSGTILNLNCGTGLVGSAAATLNSTARVIMTDRNFLAVEAARKTVEQNRLNNAEVHFSNGCSEALNTHEEVDLVVIRLPKGKRPAEQLLWDGFRALKIGGLCHLAGGNREGIKPAIEWMGQLFGAAETTAYRGGHRLARTEKTRSKPAEAGAIQEEWLDHKAFLLFPVDVRGTSLTVHSRPGAFAWDRLDEGTRLLVEHMVIHPGDAVLDLGCGNGIIGMVAGRLAPQGRVMMVDVDAEAIRSARRSVEANALHNCTIAASDAGSMVKHMRFDVVVTNPPFHVGRRAEFDIARQFIMDAGDVLNKGGRFYLVANMKLPYEESIRERFGAFRVESQTQGYKVISALKQR